MTELLYEILIRPWSSPWYAGNTLDSAVLLSVAALGIVLAFRSGAFNLGGESQIYAGGIAATAILLAPLPLPSPIILFIALLAALASGAVPGAISGILKTQSGADPMISSFLLASIVMPIGDWLISGPMRDSTSDLLASPRLPQGLMLSRLLPPSSLNSGLFIMLIAALCIEIFLKYSVAGLGLRAAGSDKLFARYAGISSDSILPTSLAAGGALHGLAGFLLVAGSAGICHLSFPAGLGWNAIAVALIAGNRPLAVIPAAILFAWLEEGSRAAILASGMSLGTRSFLVALVFLLITAKRRGRVR